MDPIGDANKAKDAEQDSEREDGDTLHVKAKLIEIAVVSSNAYGPQANAYGRGYRPRISLTRSIGSASALPDLLSTVVAFSSEL